MGNSRTTKRILPVSISSFFTCGNTSFWKWAQWGQVSEAYSITVTGAFGLPSIRSPSGPACINSSGDGTLSALSEAASAVGPAPPPHPECAIPTARRSNIVGRLMGSAYQGCLLRWWGWGRPFGFGFVRIGRGGRVAERDLEVLNLMVALQPLAVDEEGWR